MRGVLKNLSDKVVGGDVRKPHPSSFTVAKREYRVKQLLGEGAYAFVWLCREDGSSDDVAIKQVLAQDAAAQRAAAQELELMQAVAAGGCAHLVQLIASQATPQGRAVEYLLVQDYCPVSLFAMMQQRVADGAATLDVALVLAMAGAVAEGLAWLHAHNITHRDVKPENVLQRSDKWLLVDFGSCMRGVRRPASEDERNTLTDELNAQTTLIYRAPEMLDLFRNQPIGPPSDVWALGCTTYYALYLNHPFKEDGELAILNGRLRFPPAHSDALASVNEFIQALLTEDPAARPLAATIRAQTDALAATVTGDGARPRVGMPVNVRRAEPSKLDPELQRSIAAAKKSPRVQRVDVELAEAEALATSPSKRAPSRRVPLPPGPSASQQQQQQQQQHPPPPVAAAPSAPAAVEDAPSIRNDEVLAEAKTLLADIKTLRDPEMWKIEIAPECNVPASKDIVIRSWTVAARQFSAVQRHQLVAFFSLFRSRESGGTFVIQGRPLDCLQMVSIFHLALQTGSFLAMACGHHCRTFLEEVVRANGAPQGELVAHYAQYLAERVAFHHKHRIFEGNMSLGTYTMVTFLNRAKMGWSPRPGAGHGEQLLINADTIKDLLVLLGKAINLEARLLKYSAQATLIPFIIPVIKETFSLSTIICCCMRHFWIPFAGATPVSTLLDPLNRSLAVLAAHYAEINAIAVIASTMGPAPPLFGPIPDPSDPAAALHPFYVQQVAYPPSHSPFVQAYETQRQLAANAAAAQMQAQQQAAESFFPATFDAPAAAPATIPPAASPLVAVQAELYEETVRVDAAPAVERKERAQKLRSVGSRRGSIKDISSIRDKELAEAAERNSNAALAKLLAGSSKEDLVEEVMFLRKKVASLETQLAMAMLEKHTGAPN